MKLKELVPELIVNNVSRSIEFYKKIGFNVTQTIPNKDFPVWAEIINGSTHLMLQEWKTTINDMPILASRPKGGITIFVLRLGDKDEVQEIAKKFSKQQNIFLPRNETEYGTVEFGITDPDGYQILFSAKV